MSRPVGTDMERQPGFFLKLNRCLLPGRHGRLEVPGDAVPEATLVSDGLAALEERDPPAPLNDDGHHRTGWAEGDAVFFCARPLQCCGA
jgi:hypothetical protein